MSKHLLEGLAALSHMSLLQTDCGNCEPFSGTLNIHLMEQDEQGNTTDANDMRYVKVSDSKGNSQIYELPLVQGEASLTIDNIHASQVVVVQVDAQGTQMIDGDQYAITYYTNEEITENDYATHYFHQGEADQQLRIINRRIPCTSLTIVKVLLDEYHNQMDFCEDMNFVIHIEGMGICQTVDLNMTNHFQVCLDHLRSGRYQVYEEETACYRTTYRLDGGTAVPAPVEIQLNQENHILDVINTKRPNSVLTLDKYIRDGSGELMKPQNDECFHVRVIGDYFDQIFTLDCENDFAMDIFDLPSGCYDVQEVDCDIYDVTYLVNAEKESTYAHVEVRECESSSVLIINNLRMCCEQDSPLRICKFVRRSDGCLVKPDPCLSFKVMLAGCGVCETFNLNASNNFCVDIEHICCGEYEVRELDHEEYVCSYIVNDGCETTRACLCIHEGGRNCVNIINEERNKGEVSICKVIRQGNGELIKPDKSSRFLVTLRSFFCRETFVLDASNDFCVHVYNLKEGSYEVRERRVDGFDTTYIINGCKEERKARFLVENGCCKDIKIVNSARREESGDLRICKYIANPFGDYVKPAADEEFNIQVEGPCLQQCYTLRAANNWCVILEGLKKGVYRIHEQSACDYTSQYFVNGEEMEEALVCMDACNQEVEIINTRRSFGNLKLSVVVQDCDGCMRKPSPNEAFEILIESICDSRSITLDACNNFGVLLEDMEKGKYRITQKDSYGYKVLYEVDGESMSRAMVTMDGCNVSVVIVNQIQNCSGLVRVRKWIETLDGDFVKPCDEDSYDFCLTSRCIDHMYTLCGKNDFCVFFDDLEEGAYEIKELCEDPAMVRYCINEQYQENGCFDLGRNDVVVDIINKEMPKPSVCVQKRIREDGCLVKPEPCESFEFILSGRGVHERYCLNCENDWCICIEDLCNQHYEIKEIDQDCHTLYQINDQLSEQGYFLFEQKDMDITIINEERCDPCVIIDKYVEDDCGRNVKPCRDDCFEIMLESDCYKQCFALNAENNWCLEIHGLACGEYEIREMDDAYCAEIRIQDVPQKRNCFTLAEEDIQITMINREACHNRLEIYAYEQMDQEVMTPSSDQVFYVDVEHEGTCDHFVLNCENEWCFALEDIDCGLYRISSREEDMLYEVEGQCFENCVEIDMECGCTTVVKLLAQRCVANDITIMKRIRNAAGEVCKPKRGDCYSVELRGACEGCYDLNAKNDWCICLEDYPAGIYEVKECSEDPCVEYQIDEHAPVSQGYFTLANRPVSITVINPEEDQHQPILTIHAMVKNCDGDLETAPADARFDVMLDGWKVQEDFTLTHRNGFQRIFDQLPNGDYTVTQDYNNAFTRVTYRVNGLEQPKGEIHLEKEDIQVDIINYMNCEKGSIRVMKYKKDESCGCLKRPCMEEEYDIEIHGADLHQVVVLNASNKWCYVFDNLADGEYTITEKNAQGNVTYMVNGGKESNEAKVMISGNEANVKVINADTVTAPTGSIEICKQIKDGEGRYHYPDGDESYWITITGEGKTQRILLHKANHFFVEVRHLEAGTYEIKEEDGVNVRYVVNGGKEQARAIVKVNGDKNSVNVINPGQTKGALTITKHYQNADGTLQKPDDQETYRVHVTRPGFNQVVTLNPENHYTYTLEDLAAGMYVVDELDHEDVTYIVDGGSQVDQGVVYIEQEHHLVQVINASASAKGSMKLTKFIRNANGQLVRPSGNSSYRFHISKPQYNEIITLTPENDWKMELTNLTDGNYVIAELDQTSDVSYIINDGSETDFGIVNVYGNANNVQIINASSSNENGSITITKYVRSASGELQRPKAPFQTKVHISRTGYNEVFTLNQANNWEISIYDLMDGSYVIDEVDSSDDVTWRINGGYEVRYAVVDVAHNENQVDMIDAAASSSGTIQINKLIRNANGQLILPNQSESFDVVISGAQTKRVTLNARNRWNARVSGLSTGMYQIQEVTETNYDVSYIINDGEEVTTANVMVSGNEQSVGIINSVRTNRNQLEITKYVKMSNGTLNPPAAGDVYQIEIRNGDFQQIVTLNEANRFSEKVVNLESGTYSVKEVGNSDTTITYRVNGGQETSSATITVSEGKNNVVEVINERNSDKNTLDVYKFMVDAAGNYVKPQSNQVFRFLLTGNNFHQFYTLSSANDWHVNITSLASGEYEVIEQGSGQYDVRYYVNGTDMSETAEFEAGAGTSNIVEIVNQERGGRDGRLRLEKKIRDTSGSLVNQGNGESFQVRVFSNENAYDELFTLDSFNGYELSIPNLAYGIYEVSEVASPYQVTYIVNDGMEQRDASVSITSSDENSVLIINTQSEPVFAPAKDNGIHIVIE